MNKPLRLIFTALALFALISVAEACPNSGPESREPHGREKVMAELKPYRQKFFAKELKLTKEQTREFFALYDSMEEELRKINDETRNLEESVLADDKATDTQAEAAARATFEQKSREAAVELSYYEKFKGILSPRQLLGLKTADRKFTQWLVRNHRRLSRERNENESRR